MSYQIAICDDERAEIAYLRLLVDTWARERKASVALDSFDSAEGFLFAYAENKAFDILLLDVQMKGMDGVALAKRIRRDNASVQIIFITGYSEFMADGYEVSALHYLLKPVEEQKLWAVLDRAVQNVEKREKNLLLTAEGAVVRVPLGDIRICESFGHRTLISAKTGSYEARMPISEVERQLDSGFVRCHRSYIVGIRHISRITRTEVVLDEGTRAPLSRRLYEQVNQAFIRYFTAAPSDITS